MFTTLSEPMWMCTLCGHVVPVEEPNTESWERMDDGWTCPDCCATKDMFTFCRCVRLDFEPVCHQETRHPLAA